MEQSEGCVLLLSQRLKASGVKFKARLDATATEKWHNGKGFVDDAFVWYCCLLLDLSISSARNLQERCHSLVVCEDGVRQVVIIGLDNPFETTDRFTFNRESVCGAIYRQVSRNYLPNAWHVSYCGGSWVRVQHWS